VGNGKATLYPGTYSEYLWSKQQAAGGGKDTDTAKAALSVKGGGVKGAKPAPTPAATAPPKASDDYEVRKREAAERKKREKMVKGLADRISELESRIAEKEDAIKMIETEMSVPGFYDQRDQAKAIVDKHQHLMWEVGDLLNQWEMLQTEIGAFARDGST
jgi:predicted RNase H-like nuclease (RuvC/YqgF family)